MALGKAFIEVHADTKPFARELGKELGRILATVEKTVARKQAEKIGETVSTSVGDGVRKNRSKTTSAIGDTLKESGGLFTRFAKGIVDTIDDGLSGLPAELKLALGIALAGVVPVAIAFGAAIVSAIGVGIASGGTIFAAFQFEEVQDRFDELVGNLRKLFLGDGRSFIAPVFDAFDRIEERASDLVPVITSIFEKGGKAIGPLVDGLIDFSENFLTGLNEGLVDIESIAVILGQGLGRIGTELGYLFSSIGQNDDTREALSDLIDNVVLLTRAISVAIGLFLDFYGVIDSLPLGILVGRFDVANIVLDENKKRLIDAAVKQREFGSALFGTLTPLESQERALKELTDQANKYTQATFEALDIEISFEEGLDRLTDSLKRNGTELRLTEPAGRENARALQELAKKAIDARDNTLLLTQSQTDAQAVYDEHIAKVYAAGAAYKLSKADIDRLIVGINSIPVPTLDVNTKNSAAKLDAIIARYREINALIGFRPAELGTSIQGGYQYKGYADGGIFDSPTVGMFGEAGREVIIPTTKPKRAAELIQQSGLGDMFGGGATNVNVYIGNQQIDAYVDDRVDRRMSSTARTMSYGSRGI